MSKPEFKIGDAVSYEMWDGEEGRGYGWFLNTKKAKIVSICYKLDNGDIVEEKKLVLLENPINKQNESGRAGSTTG